MEREMPGRFNHRGEKLIKMYVLGIRLSWSVVYPKHNLELLVEEELTNEMSGSIEPKTQRKI